MSEQRCYECKHFGLSKDIRFNIMMGVCSRTGKEIKDIEECPFYE